MAILKDTTVSGNLRVTDSAIAEKVQTKVINAPTTSGGATYGPGSNGQVLKSNGTTTYWASDNNSVTGVKGNAESSYRTGQVNLTSANVGAVAVSQGTGNAGKFLMVNSSGNVEATTVTTKAATTYNTSTSDQTIAAGTYLTGAQTIKAVTTSGIDATNIKDGAVIKVGDANSATRIKNVTGTFTDAATVSSGQTAAAAAQIRTGYSAWVDGAEVKGSIANLAATTYNTSTSDQTIASGKYISGTQTIKAVTTSNIDASNIKKDVVVTVGDANSATRIKNVTGTFTTTPSGKTALTAAALRSGYAGFINGSQVNGSMADTSVTEGTTTVSGTTATRGTWSQTAGYTAARTVAAATFANSATSGTTYVDISSTTASPVLVAGNYLYINKGYTDNLKISLAKLVPDGSDVKGHGEYILSGHSAYDNDGTLVAGTIPTLSSTDMSASGKTVTITVDSATGGYLASSLSASVADGSVTPAINSHSITTAPVVTGSLSGTVTNIGTTTKPSGTDGTDYWTITPSGSVTTTGKSTANAKATVSAGYIASSPANSGNSVINITPTVSAGTAKYLAKATSSTTNGTASATANAGTASISKQPSASATATANGMDGGYYTDTTTSSYYVDCSASAASGYSTATGGSASASVTASSVTVGVGYNPSSVTAGTSASSTGNKTGNTATSTEVTASTSKKIYLKPAIIAGSSTNATATTTVAPGTVAITKQDVPSGVTQAASGNATTTAPSSGVYVAVKATAAANTTGTTSAISGSGTANVTSAGYAPTSLTGTVSVSGTATAKTYAKDSSMTYVPIKTVSGSIGGTASSGSATAAITNVDSMNTISDISGKTAGTDYWTVKATATGGAGSYTPKYTVSTAGWIGSTVTGTAQTVSVSSDSTGKSIYIPKEVHSTSISTHNIDTTPVVTGSLSGTITNIGTTTKPSGTDGTDYWTITPSGSVTRGGVSTAIGKTTISTAGYAITGDTYSDTSSINISASVNNGSNRYIPKAAIAGSSTNATATTTVAPGTVSVSKQDVPSGVTQAASGNATTTAPSSGVYVAVKATAAANTTGTTSSISGSGTATVSTAGYAPTTLTGTVSVSGTATAKTSARDSSMTYIPITTATPAFDGGTLSGGSTATGTNVTLSTTDNGMKIQTAYTASSTDVLYNGAVAGWVSKADNAVALAGQSKASTNGTAYYVTAVTMPKDKKFTVTTTADTALDTTSDLDVTNNAYRRVDITNNANGSVIVTGAGSTTFTSGSATTGNLTASAYNDSGTIESNKSIVSAGKWVTPTVSAAGTYYGKVTVDSGSVVASVYERIGGMASISANGFTASSSATSYYVSLSTTAGSVKAKATGVDGFVTSSSTDVTASTSVDVSGNGNIIYIPAGSASANLGSVNATVNTTNTSGISVTPNYSNTAGYNTAHTNQNGTTKYINAVTLIKSKSFSITVYTGSSTTNKFTFTTDSNGNTTVTES